MHRALLIDDEPAARDDLRRLLGAHPEVVVVGEAGRAADAEALLRRGRYELVLLDVELRGGNAFDLLPRVRPGAAIVFVTAHSHYAVRAFEVNALDYLVKPIKAERLATALARVGMPARVLPGPTTTLRTDDLVLLHTDAGAAHFVRVNEVAAVLSNQNYTEVRLLAAGRLLVRRTLKSWEDNLPAADFMRVHRTAVVNLHAIAAVAPQDRETVLLTVRGSADPIRARRALWPELKERLVAFARR